MYSVVLMAALTAGTNTPAWGCHGCWGGRLGCHGCWGVGAGWCGCHGGWGLCYGCYGGYGCNGWYSGCYGCCGGACYGGYGFGCYGYGSGWYYAAACYGTGCYGCTGPVYAPAAPVAPGAAPPAGTAPEQVPAPKKEEGKTTALEQAARLIVTLPANAKLYVDDQLTKATSQRRVFNSPRLEPGQTYYYILRAEMTREGKTQSETKRVLLHAGDVIETSFLDLGKLVPVGTEASARR